MDYHIENTCEKKGTFFSRKIFCPVGCGLRLMRRDVIEHVSYYCKRRLTDCPFRCGQSVQVGVGVGISLSLSLRFREVYLYTGGV